MSNRIDFFQSAQSRPALPAATVSIQVDGQLCPVAEPVEIVRSGWPEFSWARLTYNPASYTGGDLIAAEDVEVEFAMGKSICIRQYYNGVPPGASAFSFPIFCGQIEGIETMLGPKGQRVEITARDFSANLNRITVYGRRVAQEGNSTAFLPGLDTIFNPDGKANANRATSQVNGKSYTIFCTEPSQGRLWSYAEVIDYLLSEYLPGGRLQIPAIRRLAALAENQVVRDLDVTGLSLLKALHRCCERVGLQFKFVPRPVPTGPGEAIVFYRDGTGRVIELNCQQGGEQFSISKTNIAGLSSRKDFWPITHKYVSQGDFKVYEATFDLVEAWDPGLEDTNYNKFSPSTNPDFYQVKDVYRKWTLNEAGDYSGEPYNQGDAFDFSKVFSTSNYAHRRRRFWPALTADKQGKSLSYFLQVSWDGGDNWWQYLYAFNNLLDECGLWLSSDQLDVDTWVAALKGVLKFRITASVISDERLTCEAADGPVNSTAPVVEHLITLPRQFKYREVSGRSIFAGACDEGLGVPDEADDTDALYEFIRHRAGTSGRTIETADVRTPCLMLHYEVGDTVGTSPDSRDLFSCRSDNRSKSRIERVQMDFQKQCTNLKIIRKRV